MLGGIGKAIGKAVGGMVGGGGGSDGGGGGQTVIPPRLSLDKYMLPQDMGSPARDSAPAPVTSRSAMGEDPVSYYALLIREILDSTGGK